MVAKKEYIVASKLKAQCMGRQKVRRDLSWMRIQIISYFGQRLARRLTSFGNFGLRGQ